VRSPDPSLRMRSRMSAIPAGSSPLVGSSRISSSGLLKERGRHSEALLHAQRVRRELVARPVRQVNKVEYFLDPPLRDARTTRDHAQVVPPDR
jgi:hypothetical protein